MKREPLQIPSNLLPFGVECSEALPNLHFENLVVNQTQFQSLPSLPFSELIPIKHALV